MLIRFAALPTDAVRALQRGGTDAYAFVPERQISDGQGTPCRHCLRNVPEGKPYLILAYRPFPTLQPYAETGPIFLCAEECQRAPDTDMLPEIFRHSPDYIVRGYGQDDRIVYGTGAVVGTGEIRARAGDLLERKEIAYLHVRSAKNNCYQCRVDRSED